MHGSLTRTSRLTTREKREGTDVTTVSYEGWSRGDVSVVIQEGRSVNMVLVSTNRRERGRGGVKKKGTRMWGQGGQCNEGYLLFVSPHRKNWEWIRQFSHTGPT